MMSESEYHELPSGFVLFIMIVGLVIAALVGWPHLVDYADGRQKASDKYGDHIPSWVSWIALFFFLIPGANAQLANECLDGSGGRQSLVVVVPADIAESPGTLIVDDQLLIHHGDSETVCAGASVRWLGPGNSLTAPGYLSDPPLPPDPRQLPLSGTFTLVLQRGNEVFDVIAHSSFLGVEKDNPFPYEGTEIFVLTSLVPIIATVAESGPRNDLVFPNPSHGIFRLSRTTSWQVFDLQGRLLTRGGGSRIDLTNQPSSVYAIVIDGEAHIVTKL